MKTKIFCPVFQLKNIHVHAHVTFIFRSIPPHPPTGEIANCKWCRKLKWQAICCIECQVLGKKLIFALKQICKMSWANLNLVTSDSNVMLGKCFFMAMMLSIKEFCLHFIFKLYWFYPNDWNAWYDLCVIKSLLFFTMLMVVGINRASVCLHMFTNPLVMASK